MKKPIESNSFYKRRITDPKQIARQKKAAKLMPESMRKEIAASLYIDDKPNALVKKD